MPHKNLLWAVAGACCGLASCIVMGLPQPYDIGHRGAGRVAVVFENEEDDSRELFVYDERGGRRVVIPEAKSAHWLGPDSLLVAVRSQTDAGDYLPRVQLQRLDLASGAFQALGPPGLYYDPQPDPTGKLLALGVDVNDLGDSELQIWDVESPGEPLARRAQTLDRPRWSPGGRHLVVSQPRADSDDVETHEGVSIEGVSITWSRLFRLRRDLEGKLRAVHDGEPNGTLAAGGTLPLWWDEQGIWARQREGLVRCNAKGGGCWLIYEPGEQRSVVDGCATAGTAWLAVRTDDGNGAPNQIHRVAVSGWGGSRVFHAPHGRNVAGIDCAD